MIKCKKRGVLIIVLFATVIALSVQAIGFNGAKAFAKEDENTVTLSTELEKITSVETLDAGDITFYTANSWAGYKRIVVDAANKGEHPQVLLNNVVVNNGSDLELVHFRGGENAVHTIGIWGEDGGPNRIVSFAYTAKQTGKLYMPETSLQIIESTETAIKEKTFNASLGMYIVKGTSEYKIEDQVWSYYQAGNIYTLTQQVFDVVEGDNIFVHFYSKKEDTTLSQMSFVSFKYNPSFIFEAPAASEHAFNHVQKLSLDANGALINDVRITDKAIDVLTAELDDSYNDYKEFIDDEIEEITSAIDDLKTTINPGVTVPEATKEETPPPEDDGSEDNPTAKERWTSWQDAADAGFSNIAGAGASERSRVKNWTNPKTGNKYTSYQEYLDVMYEKYMGKAPKYHSGGFVDDYSNLQSNEVFAKLLRGEFVSTPAQMDKFVKETLPMVAAYKSGEATINYNSPLIEIQCGSVSDETLPKLNDLVNKAVERIKKDMTGALSRTGYRKQY